MTTRRLKAVRGFSWDHEKGEMFHFDGDMGCSVSYDFKCVGSRQATLCTVVGERIGHHVRKTDRLYDR